MNEVAVSRHVRLLATDLDGTVIGGVHEFPLYTDFRKTLSWLHETNGALWVACTGRNLSSFVEFTMPLQRMGVAPDYVIVKHAYIYSRSRFGWMPHLLWNLHIKYVAWVDKYTAEQALSVWHRTVVSCSIGVRTMRKDRQNLTLQFDTSESATEALRMLKSDYSACRHIQVVLRGTELKVRLVPFTKGLALSELARYIGVPRADILAIGNGHNDISMLDGSFAAMTGCPSNSEVEVMETVNQAGGHIADRPSLGGVLQVIDAYRAGTVSSALPAEVVKVPRQDPFRHSSRSEKGKRPQRTRMYIILAIIGYIVLLVFANFGLLPYSYLIMKPIYILQKIVERIVS